MGHRISITVDYFVWLELQKIPQGERSRLISEAVSKELQRRSHGRTVAEMDRLRKTRPRATASTEELIRADRDAHW